MTMKQSIQNFVIKTLNLDILELSQTDKGLTNQNYYLKSSLGEFIIRWPHHDAHHVVNRSHEAKAMEKVKDLDVDIFYFDEKTGIKVSKYIPHLLTFNEYTGVDKIKRTAKLMKSLHEKKITIGENFDPISRYKNYEKRVKTPMVAHDEAQGIIEGIAYLDRPLTLCHNDWVEGNICFTQERDYLIDYEYAGDNDPFFDITSFLTENHLTSDERWAFVKAYFKRKPTMKELDILERYARFHNLLWCTWGMMMYESRNEAIYKNIAYDKWNALHHKLLP